MKIQSINFNINNINHPIKRISAPSLPESSDTFIRTVSFGSSFEENNFEAFKKWAHKTGFLSNAAKIINSEENIIGTGTEGIIYQIPDNENWVIKEHKRLSLFNNMKTEKAKIVKVTDKSPFINIGQPVAKIIIPVNEKDSKVLLILKKQRGRQYGVAFEDRNRLTSANIKKHLYSLKLMSSLPMKTYRNMVREIAQANADGYRIDFYNPNNILIDEENQKVNFVDITDDTGCSYPQHEDMLYAILGGNFAINYNKSNTSPLDKAAASRYSSEILFKYEQAMKECGIKFNKSSGYLLMIKKFI